MMSNKAASLKISGSIPCVICWEPITQENVERGDVICNMGMFVYPAHTTHFFLADNKTPTNDYEKNLTRFALAYGIGERHCMPHLKRTLKPLYKELRAKMRGWNHPAFVVHQYD